MDRSGSHVAESALKSLATHLENPDAYSVIEEALHSICKVLYTIFTGFDNHIKVSRLLLLV